MLSLNEMSWSPDGYAAFSGELLKLYRRVDEVFIDWANELGATEFQFPDFISSAALKRIDYMRSFGHLATLPCRHNQDTGKIEALEHSTLTPAACYHFYDTLKESALTRTTVLTTRANCFRREETYTPLQRQWCFSMREIVCIGTEDDVLKFLQQFRQRLEDYFTQENLEIQFVQAADPFFNPRSNPRYIMQLLEPLKLEATFENGLAVASLNNHRTTFGDAFNITINGSPAHSGCVAFGVERWMHMLLNSHHQPPSTEITA